MKINTEKCVSEVVWEYLISLSALLIFRTLPTSLSFIYMPFQINAYRWYWHITLLFIYYATMRPTTLRLLYDLTAKDPYNRTKQSCSLLLRLKLINFESAPGLPHHGYTQKKRLISSTSNFHEKKRHRRALLAKAHSTGCALSPGHRMKKAPLIRNSSFSSPQAHTHTHIAALFISVRACQTQPGN